MSTWNDRYRNTKSIKHRIPAMEWPAFCTKSRNSSMEWNIRYGFQNDGKHENETDWDDFQIYIKDHMSCLCLCVFTGLCLVVYCETYSSLLHRVFTGKFTRSSRVMTPSLLVSSSSNEAVAIAASTYQTQQMVNDVLHGGKSDRKSSLDRTSMSFCFF